MGSCDHLFPAHTKSPSAWAMSLTSSSSSRDRNKYANKEKYSAINRIAIAERASLEEVDRPSYIYVCHDDNDDDNDRDIGKHDFRSVLFHLMLRYVMLTRQEGCMIMFQMGRLEWISKTMIGLVK